jgi:putative photosynthetic complex assembly protein
MSDPFLDNPVPRKALIAIAALIGFSLLVVVAARLTGYNASQVPDSPPIASRDLRFADAPDGSMLVSDIETNRKLATLPPGNAGFVRGVLRVMHRERRARHVSIDTPYRLVRHADGRLTFEDLGTQRTIELNSFGPSNEGAFAAFLGDRDPIAARNQQSVQAGQNGHPL